MFGMLKRWWRNECGICGRKKIVLGYGFAGTDRECPLHNAGGYPLGI